MEAVAASTEQTLSDWSNVRFDLDRQMIQTVEVGVSYVEIIRFAREHDSGGVPV